jgi:peptidoglycan/LPS O-acetylase OafA/YrhL
MTFIPSPNLPIPGWAAEFVSFGGSGVVLFFVVSAFSLCLTMPLHARETPDLRAFYIRRFFRIAPLFYFLIIATLVRDYYIFGATHSLGEILASVSFLFNFSPQGHEGFVWASWTIGIEMVFYAIFPFLYRISTNATKIVCAILIALWISVAFRQIVSYASLLISLKETFYGFSFVRHLPIFVFGILGYYIASRSNELHMTKPLGATLMCGAFYGFYSLLNGGLNVIFPDPLYWQAVLYTLLLVGMSVYPAAILVNRFTTFLGKISYSIYLIHPNIILFLLPVYKSIYAWALPNSAKFGISAAITASCVITVSYLTFLSIEKPGISVGRRLLKQAMARHLLRAASVTERTSSGT